MLPNREPDVTKKYQLTNLTNNNNKWWTIKWWKAERIAEIQYGRVGQACVRPAIKKDIGQKQFDKLIRDREKPKEEGAYKEITTGIKVNRIADTSGLSQKLVRRIENIFKAANENIHGFLNSRIEDLAPEQIDKGKQQLQILFSAFADYKKKENKTNEERLIEEARIYYEAIPSHLPYKINALNVAINLGKNLAEEEDKLEALAAALKSSTIATAGGSILDQLGCKMEEVTAEEFAFAEKYFNDTKKHAEYRSLKVKEVWKVEIPQERKYFLENPVQTNIKTLWHGTRNPFVRNIARTGLKKPKIEGYSRLFGFGVYLADVSTKSINYCGYDSEKYLFLVDCALGKTYNTDSYLNWTEMKVGYDSIFAEAGKPIKGSYNNHLNYNEYVTFSERQQTIKYLVVVE